MDVNFAEKHLRFMGIILGTSATLKRMDLRNMISGFLRAGMASCHCFSKKAAGLSFPNELSKLTQPFGWICRRFRIGVQH